MLFLAIWNMAKLLIMATFWQICVETRSDRTFWLLKWSDNVITFSTFMAVKCSTRSQICLSTYRYHLVNAMCRMCVLPDAYSCASVCGWADVCMCVLSQPTYWYINIWISIKLGKFYHTSQAHILKKYIGNRIKTYINAHSNK